MSALFPDESASTGQWPRGIAHIVLTLVSLDFAVELEQFLSPETRLGYFPLIMSLREGAVVLLSVVVGIVALAYPAARRSAGSRSYRSAVTISLLAGLLWIGYGPALL